PPPLSRFVARREKFCERWCDSLVRLCSSCVKSVTRMAFSRQHLTYFVFLYSYYSTCPYWDCLLMEVKNNHLRDIELCSTRFIAIIIHYLLSAKRHLFQIVHINVRCCSVVSAFWFVFMSK
ncbi:hypothetical protein Tcan_00502, partial [Toxocara canis]